MRLGTEVIQTGDARNHTRDRGRHHRIRDIADMLLALGQKRMDACAEGLLHLGNGSAHHDQGVADRRIGNRQPLGGEPARDLRQIRGRQPELLAKLLRREPVVIERRPRRLLGYQQLIECGLLRSGAAEKESHALKLASRCGRPKIGRGFGAARNPVGDRSARAPIHTRDPVGRTYAQS